MSQAKPRKAASARSEPKRAAKKVVIEDLSPDRDRSNGIPIASALRAGVGGTNETHTGQSAR